MSDGATGFVVGDVSGHGLGSALLTALTQAHLHSLVEMHTDLCEILGRANRCLAKETDHFVTLFFGFPTAYFIATRAPNKRDLWLFLITIPFWTNILIRTFAMQEVIRNEGIVNSALMGLGLVDILPRFTLSASRTALRTAARSI